MEEWKGGRMEGWGDGKRSDADLEDCGSSQPRMGDRLRTAAVSSSEAAIQESLGRQAKNGRMEDWKGGGMESGQMFDLEGCGSSQRRMGDRLRAARF